MKESPQLTYQLRASFCTDDLAGELSFSPAPVKGCRPSWYARNRGPPSDERLNHLLQVPFSNDAAVPGRPGTLLLYTEKDTPCWTYAQQLAKNGWLVPLARYPPIDEDYPCSACIAKQKRGCRSSPSLKSLILLNHLLDHRAVPELLEWNQKVSFL